MNDPPGRLRTVAVRGRTTVRGLMARTRESSFLRFLIAGAVNTLFGFTVYGLAFVAGAPLWLALLTGMVAGTLFNFVTTAGYVFRQLALRYFPRFVICYVAVYATNLLLIELLVSWSLGHIVAQAILSFPLALLSYVLMSRFVFVARTRFAGPRP